MSKFECKYCGEKFPLEKESITEIIEHLKTHRAMPHILIRLTKASLEVACKNKKKIIKQVNQDTAKLHEGLE